MSVDEAYKLLGVNTSSAFDDVLAAKNRLVQRLGDNKEKRLEVEAAYDVVLTASMKRRLSGELQVSNAVRYADVPTVRKAKAFQQPANATKSGLPQLQLPLPNTPRVQLPAQKVAATQAAVFSALLLWSYAQVNTEPAQVAAIDVPGLQIALGTAYALYTFKENKRLGVGRTIALALAFLVSGSLVGALLESFLRLDIVPVWGLTPNLLVSETGLLGLWAGVALFV